MSPNPPALGRIAAVLAALALGACAQPTLRPDLARMYRVAAVSPDTTPVIVIPGLFGSKLRDRRTGVQVWPGDFQRVAFSDYRDLELGFDPATLAVLPDDLEAYDIADRVLGIDFYGPLIETLAKFGGYAKGTPGTPVRGGERRYYTFAYDWRQDNVTHAVALDRFIDQVRRDYGDPALRVDIVAHSMGGLVSRYYLRYGPVDVLDGSPQLITLYGTERVRKLILLGTPNFGAVSALHAFLRGEPIGLNRIAPEVIATLPSGYQLFPHPLAAWLVDSGGNALADDLYEAATWQRYAWGVFDPAIEVRTRAAYGAQADARLAALRRYFEFRLERARRFAWMLSTPEPATPIRYVLFGGNCELTPARVLVEEEDGRPRARLEPGEVKARRAGVPYDELLREPGDGRVTKPSLLARETLDPTAPQHEEAFLPIAYFFFLCERHDQLTSNVNFQDNLLNILLTRQLPWETMAPTGAATAAPAPAQ